MYLQSYEPEQAGFLCAATVRVENLCRFLLAILGLSLNSRVDDRRCGRIFYCGTIQLVLHEPFVVRKALKEGWHASGELFFRAID